MIIGVKRIQRGVCAGKAAYLYVSLKQGRTPVAAFFCPACSIRERHEACDCVIESGKLEDPVGVLPVFRYGIHGMGDVRSAGAVHRQAAVADAGAVRFPGRRAGAGRIHCARHARQPVPVGGWTPARAHGYCVIGHPILCAAAADSFRATRCCWCWADSSASAAPVSPLPCRWPAAAIRRGCRAWCLVLPPPAISVPCSMVSFSRSSRSTTAGSCHRRGAADARASPPWPLFFWAQDPRIKAGSGCARWRLRGVADGVIGLVLLVERRPVWSRQYRACCCCRSWARCSRWRCCRANTWRCWPSVIPGSSCWCTASRSAASSACLRM